MIKYTTASKGGFGGKLTQIFFYEILIKMEPPTIPLAQAAQSTYQPSNSKNSMPRILLILGLLETVFISLPAIYVIIQVLPKAATVVGDANNNYNPIWSYGLLGLISIIPLVQVIYGRILLKKQREEDLNIAQKRNAKILLIMGIVSAILSGLALAVLVIMPIYDRVGSLK